MSAAYASSLGLVAYLTLFAAAGCLFILANLLLGRLLRPNNPNPDKLEIYECGEPPIGSSFVQFDLRFYVVALLFIVFEVEIAFFFPWATVFGKATHLADRRFEAVAVDAGGAPVLSREAVLLYREMGIDRPALPREVPATLRQTVAAGTPPDKLAADVIRAGGRQLVWLTAVDILLFFAVLLVGFAYVWKRGDLDWVRAVTREVASRQREEPPVPEETAQQSLSI